jgi:hypothetical protein
LCLAIVTALTGRTHNDSATTQPRDYRNALRIATPYCAALLIVAVLALFAERFIGGVEAFADAGIGKQLFHAFPPLMAFSLAVFAATAALCGGRWMVVAALAAAVAMATTFATDFVKPALFAVTASLLLFMGLAWLRAATILAVLGSIAGLLVVAAILVTLARSGQSLTPSFLFSDRSTNFVGGALTYKLFARQAATGGCLQRVIDRHLPAAEPGSPFYFLIAPVPRVLWPDKPNLSLGADYGVRYCDIPPTQPGAPIHSASITLLGEPIIQAGVPGLIVAQGLTIGVLAGITLICFRGGLLGLITLAALFPWLADFDQSFALYVANAIKMGLYILPALLVLAWLLRRYGQADTGWVQP